MKRFADGLSTAQGSRQKYFLYPGNILSEIATAFKRSMKKSEVALTDSESKSGEEASMDAVSKEIVGGIRDEAFDDEDVETKRKRKKKKKKVKENCESTDIHPELTVDLIRNPPTNRKSLSSASSLRDSQEPSLEINTMFDFDSLRDSHRSRRSTWGYGADRRSSIAVMASGVVLKEKCSRKYFGQDRKLRPQSLSAVHYLAISPPRIRVTKANSDDMSGPSYDLDICKSNPELGIINPSRGTEDNPGEPFDYYYGISRNIPSSYYDSSSADSRRSSEAFTSSHPPCYSRHSSVCTNPSRRSSGTNTMSNRSSISGSCFESSSSSSAAVLERCQCPSFDESRRSSEDGVSGSASLVGNPTSSMTPLSLPQQAQPPPMSPISETSVSSKSMRSRRTSLTLQVENIFEHPGSKIPSISGSGGGCSFKRTLGVHHNTPNYHHTKANRSISTPSYGGRSFLFNPGSNNRIKIVSPMSPKILGSNRSSNGNTPSPNFGGRHQSLGRNLLRRSTCNTPKNEDLRYWYER